MTQARRDISRKLRVLNCAKEAGNVSQATVHRSGWTPGISAASKPHLGWTQGCRKEGWRDL